MHQTSQKELNYLVVYGDLMKSLMQGIVKVKWFYCCEVFNLNWVFWSQVINTFIKLKYGYRWLLTVHKSKSYTKDIILANEFQSLVC